MLAERVLSVQRLDFEVTQHQPEFTISLLLKQQINLFEPNP